MKIRGFRVDVGEIETKLVECEDVADFVVAAREDRTGEKCLVAYLIASEDVEGTLSVSGLRKFLSERVPDYMVPSYYVFLDGFPMLSSGNIDYIKLPEPDTGKPKLDVSYVPPRNQAEEIPVKVWSEVLDIDSVGVYDELFDLGANSLTITKIAHRIEIEFKIKFPIHQLFDIATITELAELISKEEKSDL